jgi:predicted transcriptional regulator
MTVDLNPEQERRVKALIDSGRYQDAQAVVDRALEDVFAEEDWFTTNRDEIAAAIEEGLAQAERGELYTEEEVRSWMDAEKKAWMAEKRTA